jgi:hypothetical protein
MEKQEWRAGFDLRLTAVIRAVEAIRAWDGEHTASLEKAMDRYHRADTEMLNYYWSYRIPTE